MVSIKSLFNTQSGMSLVEMIMVFGLVAVGGLGVATLSKNMSQSGSMAEGKVARSQFTTALNSYLYSKLGCEDIKVSRPGGAFTETAQSIELTKWNYLGHTEIKPGYSNGRANTPFKYFDLVTLEAYLDPQANAVKIPSGTLGGGEEELAKSTLNIHSVIKVGNKSYRYLFNIPVLVNNSGRVRFCSEEKIVAESCAAIKGIYNPDTKECEVDEGCLLRDTYTVLSCSGAGGACDTRLGSNKPNKYTGGQSCPAGSSATRTHLETWTKKISCGKKCTSTQNNTMAWYMCLACPS